MLRQDHCAALKAALIELEMEQFPLGCGTGSGSSREQHSGLCPLALHGYLCRNDHNSPTLPLHGYLYRNDHNSPTVPPLDTDLGRWGGKQMSGAGKSPSDSVLIKSAPPKLESSCSDDFSSPFIAGLRRCSVRPHSSSGL